MINRIYLSLVAFFLVMFCVNSIDISTCTNLNSAGSTYNLTADILNSGTSSCLNVTVNNVTLNCQGHLIDGNNVARYGIAVSRTSVNYTGITIKNCVLTDWNVAGLYIYQSNTINISNITVSKTTGTGVLLAFYSQYNNLDNITSFNNSGYGINIDFGSRYNNLSNCIIYNNSDGIRFYGGDNNLKNSIIYNNSNRGIRVFNGWYQNLSNLIIYNNLIGIRIEDSFGNRINNITAYNNSRGISSIIMGPWSYDTIISNSNLSNNNYSLYFNGFGEDLDMHDNYIYNSYLGNSSQIYSDFQFNSTNGYFNFNYTDPINGNNYGNYFDDFVCLQTQEINGINVCVNPSSFEINSSLNIYAYVPLFTQSIGAESSPSSQSSSNSIFPLYGFSSMIILAGLLFGHFRYRQF